MIVTESLARDFARLIVWYPFRWWVSIVPQRWAVRVFAAMGRLHCRFSPEKRRRVIENAALLSRACCGTNVDLGWIERYFETHYINQLILFLFPRLNRRHIEKLHRFVGLNHLDDALGKGKGVILVHPHFGPVHLPLFHLGILGYPVWQLGYRRKPKGLSRTGERTALRLRERYEGMIPARIVQGDRFLRPVFHHLKANGVLMTTGDGTGGGEFIGRFKTIPFLSHRMLFPLGPGALALKVGACLLPLFTIPYADGVQYRTIIEPPLTAIGTAGAEELTREFAGRLEGYVERYPWCWHFWDEFAHGRLLT